MPRHIACYESGFCLCAVDNMGRCAIRPLMDVKGSPEVTCCCQEIRVEPDEMPPEYDTKTIEGTIWVKVPYSKWLKERPPL